MAVSAGTGDASAILDEIKAPPGVVLPPKEIKAILEKTAGYVARNGIVFEDRIREKEKHNPKFSFLSTNDSYHAYYLWRLDEIKAGRGNAVAAGRAGELPPEPEKPKGPPQPPDFDFSARMPNISAQDLEVVRLTALFVAKNGRQFMTTLSQRETGNYQFDFLRPNHSLHNFFQRLIDQYTMLLRAGGIEGEGGRAQLLRTRELEANVRDKFHVLARAKARAEWFKYQDQQKAQKEEAEQKEKLDYAQIDWHDFVVVETVEFTEADDHATLPAPTTLNDLQFASLDQKAQMSINSNLRIEEGFPTEEDANSYGAYPTQSTYMPPPQQPIQPSQTQYAPQYPQPRRTEEDEEEEARIRERTEERMRAQAAQAQAKSAAVPTAMKIKDNYVPRALARNANKVNMAICPNCKQQIPSDELGEHMRIELLDPRWKEQKAKHDSRSATTNLWNNDAAANLKRLRDNAGGAGSNMNSAAPANGTVGEQLSPEEEARRKRAAMGYDGDLERNRERERLERMRREAMGAQGVQEQIRAIHQKHGGGGAGR